MAPHTAESPQQVAAISLARCIDNMVVRTRKQICRNETMRAHCQRRWLYTSVSSIQGGARTVIWVQRTIMSLAARIRLRVCNRELIMPRT